MLRDFEGLKEKIDLVAWAEANIGNMSPIRQSPKHRQYNSPLNDGHDNFSIYYDGGWYDWRNHEAGNIFSLMVKLGMASDNNDAYDILAGSREVKKFTPQARSRTVLESEAPTLEQIQSYAQWLDVATPYWNSRGISCDTMKNHLMGTEMQARRPYTTFDGREIWTECQRYTIPNIWLDP
jgi:hypothetical protein